MTQDISDERMRLALDRAAHLWPHAQGKQLTRAAVQDLTAQLHCSRSSLFRHLKSLRKAHTVSALVPKKRGRKPLSCFLTFGHETAIKDCLKQTYLTRDQVGIEELLKRIFVTFQERGLPPVSRNAVLARINTISPREIVRQREGARAAREQFDLVKDHYTVTHPLAVMQIDHTKLDAFVVNEQTGRVLERPVLTICLDVHSAVICGFRIGLDAPSALVLMRAFSFAVRPKPAILEDWGVTTYWPVYGLPDAVHTDNGSDLTSKAFTAGLAEYGLKHMLRPKGHPNWGGHVERVFRTLNALIHNLPGTTRSNIKERGNRDPRKLACLTLTELRRLVASYICDVYHKTDHDRLGEPPLRRWDRYWAQAGEQPRLPTDMTTFERHFLPFETRKITRYGLRFNHLYYRSRDLQKMRDCGVGSVQIKYDPDDVRHIYVEGNHGTFVTVPCVQQFHQSISFAEHALMRDDVSTNTNKWSDADLLRHYQLRDEITGKAKKRQSRHKKEGQGARLSSTGALRPVALTWQRPGGAS